ncbi:MAG: hypothetical protein Q7T05_05165, partial [Dehalococcoidia bacterium]|nr:hypothetical protein [Dehalococcoidia bacterium]
MDTRYMNMFYTYNTYHLEDNVTRALLLTLKNLAPIHLRLFLRDVILRKPPQHAVRERIQLLADPDFGFDLQITPPDEERLNLKNGVIVGVNYSGKQALAFDAISGISGRARPDALVSDIANELTVILEIKLNDSLYKEQIQRHFLNCFDSKSTTLEQVFIEITWTEIAEFFQRVARQSVSERERLLTLEFVQYLDLLGLVEFLGFQGGDFSDPEELKYQKKPNKFLAQMTNSLQSELGLKGYGDDLKLYFEDVQNENLWVEMTEQGVNCGIVCGSGKMWRAQHLRDYIVEKPSEFRQMLEHLRMSIDPSFHIALRLHAYFRHSRFRTGWLGDIRGIKTYPEDYETFVTILADRSVNAFERMEKTVIQERFGDEIR